MNRTKLNQEGAHLVGILVAVAVFAVVGVVALRISDARNSRVEDTPAADQVEQNTSDVPSVNENADLRAAEEYTENVDIDKQLDTSELDSTLSE